MPQSLNKIQQLLISIDNQQVLVDRDVASLYGVATKRINEAVKNNPDKFLEGYVIELNPTQKAKRVENFDQLKSMKYAKSTPKAFTEKGLYMLATTLKRTQVTQTSLLIIETFAKLRALQQMVSTVTTAKTTKKSNLLKKSGELMADLLDTDLENQKAKPMWS
jgi:hypothetical protein